MNATACESVRTAKRDAGSLIVSARQSLREYLVLIKIRITAMVMLSAGCGAYLAADRLTRSGFLWTVTAALIGIGLVAAGTAAANEIVERDADAKMKRTAQRPLVTGAISVHRAIVATAVLIVGGTLLLALTTNLLTAWLTLATSIVYVAIYTPLKRITPLCTAIGAIPGAMPILLGWVAIAGRVDWQAAVLFAILFFWQFPHFHAISLLYQEDYRRGEIRMLPVVEPDGGSTRRRIVAYSFALVAATLVPTWTHMSGAGFGIVALGLGIVVIAQSFRMLAGRAATQPFARVEARRMLLASVIYLPVLMIAIVFDHAVAVGHF